MSARPTRAMTTEQANDTLTVIGVDCATQPKDIGIALGIRTHDGPRVENVWSGRSMRWDDILQHVADLIECTHTASTLIALDAPLGWPQAMGDALHEHRAGTALLRFDADEMFHRLTDDVVEKATRKKPLEVGANFIARTAHQALWFLDQVRARTRLDVPLAWTPGDVTGAMAIEVYPAATLAGRGLPHQGYKPPQASKQAEGKRRRSHLANELADIVQLGRDVHKNMVANDDLLDAVLCVVAGFDFAAGDVLRPSNEESEQAWREGWIWVRHQRPDPDLKHVLR